MDNGSKIDLDRTNASKITITTAYHHMDDGGGYAGWTEHTVIVKPEFSGIGLRITGPNRNDIKDYLGDLFYTALKAEVSHIRDEFFDALKAEEAALGGATIVLAHRLDENEITASE